MTVTTAFGPPVLHARLRSAPEDFFVEELPGFAASGEGEHLLLTIEKRGLNTAFVAKCLAEWAGIAEMGIGYAGLKDRHAVTRQRFSVHLPKRIAPDISALESDRLRVLSSEWHNRKLPRGALAGNRFVLVLRGVAGEPAAIASRLAAIRDHGFPNAFGEQRFGRGGGNLDAARRMFAGRRVRRDERSILLSAARSTLFNAVLEARVADGSWATGLDGEIWMLDGSHSVFGPVPRDAAIEARLRDFDIHPTGPLWGRGELRCDGPARALEERALAAFADLRIGLEEAGLRQERRALRARAAGLTADWLDPAALKLEFALPPGAYATALLGALGEIEEGPLPGTSGAAAGAEEA